MTDVMGQRTSWVNRITPDILPEEDAPVFPAVLAITASETVVTWSLGADAGGTSSAADPCNGIIRWYEPITGRWLANDPIGISGGLNQYVFCANNPVNFVDPSGLWRFSFGGGWGVAARASIGRNSYTGRWDINFVLGVGAGGSGSFRFNRDDPEECGHADRGASAIILGLRAEASAAIFRVLSLGGGFGTAVQADVDANNVELQNEGNISGSFFGFTGGRSGFYNKQWNPCDSFLGGREVRGTRVDPMTYDFGAYGVVGLNYGTSWSW